MKFSLLKSGPLSGILKNKRETKGLLCETLAKALA